MELIGTLGINGGMMLAQAINYGILLFVLTFLLYKPVLKILDERRERVQKSVEDARHISQQLKDMEKQRAQAMKELDAKASAILADTKKQAESAKADLLKSAHAESDSLLKRGREQLEDERRKMIADLEQNVASLSVKLAAKILQREFSDADQKRILSSIEKEIPALIK